MPTEQKTYYRASLGLKKEISGAVAADYASGLIARMRENDGRLEIPEAGLTLHLAKEFGFCYGVDKAVDMAYEAREKFPGKRIFLLTEIIHNPRVNRRMVEMGIHFLSGQFADPDLTEDDITADDVVLIPAFGTTAEQTQRLRDRGCIIVDTTCGSVVHVWKRVERYAKGNFTAVVHGKYYHEETIATVSQARAHGGHFLVVRDKAQVDAVCEFIEGSRSTADLMGLFHPEAMSAGFDPQKHLQRIGVANQTTMLASESLAFAAQIGDAIARRDGAEDRSAAENFRSFDTICSATQDRQDAIEAMLAEREVDLTLVIGGYNSSNTTHLLAVAKRLSPRAYHIEDHACLLDVKRISHLPSGEKESVESEGWLPEGPIHVAFTAGASTPNKAIANAVARLAELRGADVSGLV